MRVGKKSEKRMCSAKVFLEVNFHVSRRPGLDEFEQNFFDHSGISYFFYFAFFSNSFHFEFDVEFGDALYIHLFPW